VSATIFLRFPDEGQNYSSPRLSLAPFTDRLTATPRLPRRSSRRAGGIHGDGNRDVRSRLCWCVAGSEIFGREGIRADRTSSSRISASCCASAGRRHVRPTWSPWQSPCSPGRAVREVRSDVGIDRDRPAPWKRYPRHRPRRPEADPPASPSPPAQRPPNSAAAATTASPLKRDPSALILGCPPGASQTDRPSVCAVWQSVHAAATPATPQPLSVLQAAGSSWVS